MSLNIIKKELRKSIKLRLKQVTEENVKKQSLKVTKHITSSSWFQNSKKISIYLNMPFSELKTEDLVKEILLQNKQCFIPKTKGDDMRMVEIKSIQELNDLPKNNWNIPEPLDGEEGMDAVFNLENGLDLILLPGLGFDIKCNRIGYGKGYYDKFIQQHLIKFNKKPLLVGICLEEQICNEIPMEEYDYQLDQVVTASQIYP
ncbi:5,10-methenyltetrahydrofolate synthetase [Neoconidiobolus thromboides FSU 785]|nr:5,10-methenyltetrahydrofolate synthetase [Neoconidiobolus thromboides FSU 785]